MSDQAHTRVKLDVPGMLRQRTDQNEQATIMIHQIRNDGAERMTIEFFGQGA